MSTKEKISEQSDTLTEEGHLNEIVLFNDDVNTFDHVIDSLSLFVVIPMSRQNSVRYSFITKASVQ